MTVMGLMEFFKEWGLHISDGVEACSGHDEDEMIRAAQDLQERLREEAL